MKLDNLHHKKIGIWGFGVVGQSVYQLLKTIPCSVQIIDKKKDTHDDLTIIAQNEHSLLQFLQENDYIIASPGIPLHNYQAFAHKFIHEINLFCQNTTSKNYIAITGTVGKTSITSILSQLVPNALAAGNIGYPMLNALHEQDKTIILELSSYQLQNATNFNPKIAIWTNFYPNHLDHHQSEEEYFDAKLSIIKEQSSHSIAIIPQELLPKITAHFQPQSKIYCFATLKNKTSNNVPLFHIEDNGIKLDQNNGSLTIFNNIKRLPNITYIQNWLIIIATLYLNGIDPETVLTDNLKIPQHRLEKIATYKNATIYNDSKSTVWQSTQQAIKEFLPQRIAVVIAGLSKGTDRTPLFAWIGQQKNITVYIFGSERQTLAQACKKHQIKHYSYDNLHETVRNLLDHAISYDTIIFSPAGASFDQFKNYQDRGEQFKELIERFMNEIT